MIKLDDFIDIMSGTDNYTIIIHRIKNSDDEFIRIIENQHWTYIVDLLNKDEINKQYLQYYVYRIQRYNSTIIIYIDKEPRLQY